MNRNHRDCMLCGELGNLQDSHLVPRAVYKPLMAKDRRNQNPVLIRAGSVLQTSHQTKAHLLCNSCEQLLNRSGERTIIPLLAKNAESSPIYDLLTSIPPAIRSNEGEIYAAAEHSGFPVDALIHFAMAIFWKASVHPWERNDDEPLIKLGPYREPLRKYVLAQGRQAFPTNMCLSITVLPPRAIPMYIGPPEPAPGGDGFRNYRLYVPGLQFVLSIGKTLDTGICFASNPAHPICVADIQHLINAIPARLYQRGKSIQEPFRKSTWEQLVGKKRR